MSLSANFKSEYYNLLKACLLTLKNNKDYQSLKDNYLALKKKLDGILENKDALCVDSERLIDKETGKIKPTAELIVEGDVRFIEMLAELSELYLEKKAFENSRDVVNFSSVYVVLDIANYETYEKKIIQNLGLYDGRRVICEIKSSILPLEKEMGLNFFSEQVTKLQDLIKIMYLYPLSAPIKITKEESWVEEEIILVNGQGECFSFEKSVQINYAGGVYLELERLSDLTANTFNYYKVENLQDSQKLTLVEDETITKILENARTKLSVKFKKYV